VAIRAITLVPQSSCVAISSSDNARVREIFADTLIS